MATPWRNWLLLCLVPLPALAENDFEPDPAFGSGGRTSIGSLGPVRDDATGVVASAGEYRLTGVTNSGGATVSSARLDAAGQPVLSFGTQGFLITGASGTAMLGTGIVDSQGRSLVATFNPAGVARFLPTGGLDVTFAGDGTWNPTDQSAVYDLALGPGDSVWVSKSLDIYANAELLQLSSSGVPTGYVSPDAGALGFIPFGYARLHREADGSFWWAARGTGDPFAQVIMRFTAAGALDPSYSGDGIARATVDCIAGDIARRYQSLAVLPGGMAIVRGDHAAGSYAVAVFPDGTAGAARCEDADGTIATTLEITARDASRFVAAGTHCRDDGACGALLRQFVVQPDGTISDDPPADVDAATQFFPTSDASTPSAAGGDVMLDAGRPVLVGSANKTATDSDFFAIRLVATTIFADGFE
jgi:hypothetical protein